MAHKIGIGEQILRNVTPECEKMNNLECFEAESIDICYVGVEYDIICILHGWKLQTLNMLNFVKQKFK